MIHVVRCRSDKTGMASGHACLNIRSLLRALRGERLSAAAGLVGVWIDELEISAHEVFVIVELRPLQIDCAFGVNNDLDAVEVIDLIVLTDLLVEVNRVT